MAEIDRLLQGMEGCEASDLHLKVGARPRYRVHGELTEVPGSAELSPDQIELLTREILSKEQEAQYQRSRELDFAYGDLRTGRYRCNYFQDYRGPAAVFHRIPAVVPPLSELGLPESIESFVHFRAGLVLITGPTGAGKTTTLAALVDLINAQYRRHIITLEDPIEYIHAPKKSVIHQRGMHYDIRDFASGIVSALREDPEVIVVGELRDQATMKLAVSAAEVGVLILATMHTSSAAATVERIIDVFPEDEQPQVRAMLSQSLAGVVTQVLLRRTDKPGRIPATEVLISTPAVSNLVRESKVPDIYSVIQAGKSAGMHTLDDSLEELMAKRLVDPEEAYSYAVNKSRFEKAVKNALTLS